MKLAHIDAAEAAKRRGVSRRRIIALIMAGRLPSIRMGRQHLIDPCDLPGIGVKKAGRPKNISSKNPEKTGAK